MVWRQISSSATPCIGLKDDTIEGDGVSQRLGQVTLLKRQYATDAQHKAVELQQLLSLLDITRKTMEHASRQIVRVPFNNGNHLVLCLATVNHQGQLQFDSPTNLLFKGFQLFMLELTAPVIVETDFADGDNRRGEW